MKGHTKFKDWAVPGSPISPILPHVGPHESLDSLSGYFKILQLKDGHRFSTDDLLVAIFAAQRAPQTGTILELGAGIGTISLILSWKFPHAQITALEAQKISSDLFRRSVTLNERSNQIKLVQTDLRTFETTQRFELIVGSPPYFADETGQKADHQQKLACRFESRGSVVDYCTQASELLDWAGIFVLVFPTEPPFQREKIQNGSIKSGLVITDEIPIVFKEGEKSILSIFILTKPEFIPTSVRSFLHTAVTIRLKNGQISPEYQRLKMSIGFPP